MLNASRLDADLAMLLVIDVQEKLFPLIHDRDSVLASAVSLVQGSAIFELPVLATEQYPRGIGTTVARLNEALSSVHGDVLHKMAFSCCGDEGVRAKLREIDRRQVIVAGIETHVCILQTTLDLLSMDYLVFVCADAVGSRTPLDHNLALARMRQAGAVVTTVESALFELCVECGTSRFKDMLKLIKEGPTGNG